MPRRTPQYETYINSPEWLTKRLRLLKERGYKCERCGNKDVPLQVHHLTYDRLGDERDQDLKILCKPCHETADYYRAANTRYERARDTYLTKKYGDSYTDSGRDEEFDRWFEKKNRDGY